MKDLDRQSAEVVMGWIWSEEHSMWCDGSERDADGRLTFASPDALNWINDDPDELGEQASWHSSTNIVQALGDGGPGTIVGRMGELGWSFKLTISAYGDVAQAVFYKEFTDLKEVVINIVPAASITEAAIRAVKGDDV